MQAVYIPHICFGKCVSFRSERRDVCQKEELGNTSVGCSWLLWKVCNPEKWCLLVKGSCASSLRAQLFSRCSSEQRTRTRDLQALCAEATLPLCFWSSVDVQKDCISSNFSFTGNSVSFWISLWQVHCPQNSIITPPYPTSFNFTIWCRICGVECNVRWCRTSAGQVMRVMSRELMWAVVCRSSVALCAVDFCHCSTVGARDCFSAIEFIDNCSFRTSIFVGTCRNLVCLRGSLDAWDSRLKEEGRSRCGNWYSNLFEYIEWLSMIKFYHGCFTFFSYLDIVGHFLQQPLYVDIFIHCPGQSIRNKVARWLPRSKMTALEIGLHCEGLKLEKCRIQYFLWCKQSKEDKEERVQQMYDDRQSKQTRTSILQDSSAFRSLLQILRIRKCSIRMVPTLWQIHDTQMFIYSEWAIWSKV